MGCSKRFDGSSWRCPNSLLGSQRRVPLVRCVSRTIKSDCHILNPHDSSDQTARIHAECNLPSSSTPVWAEIARPQIHGYDMTDASFISPFRFVSGADEKVARVFDAPQGFVESLRSLGISKREAEEESRPKGATVPPLGLSNRALQKG